MTAFSSQLTDLQSVLKQFTYRFTRNPEESDDLVQDTLLKALSNEEKYRKNTNLKGWLFTIMRNTYINRYRKEKLSKLSHDQTPDLYHLHVADPHTFNKPEKLMEFKEVWKVVNEIREEHQIPFKMYTTGYKYHEIAEHLGIPIGTVKNRIFNARKEIQKKLVGYH